MEYPYKAKSMLRMQTIPWMVHNERIIASTIFFNRIRCNNYDLRRSSGISLVHYSKINFYFRKRTFFDYPFWWSINGRLYILCNALWLSDECHYPIKYWDKLWWDLGYQILIWKEQILLSTILSCRIQTTSKLLSRETHAMCIDYWKLLQSHNIRAVIVAKQRETINTFGEKSTWTKIHLR